MAPADQPVERRGMADLFLDEAGRRGGDGGAEPVELVGELGRRDVQHAGDQPLVDE